MSIDEKAFKAAKKIFWSTKNISWWGHKNFENNLKYSIEAYEAAKAPVSIEAGTEAVKAVFDLSLVGPDSGFKAEDVAKACAKAWGVKYE